jgi:hypothetical protein
MKDQSGTAIQYSGYPLTIAEPKQKWKQSPLTAVKPEVNPKTTSIQKSKISNDPKNWDEGWFNGYE